VSDVALDEFFDGWALWQEHRPQSGTDWIAVAERFVADAGDTSKSSPLFAALATVTARLATTVEALEHIESFCTVDHDRGRVDYLPYATVEQLAHDALVQIGRKEPE
jgi:hypothetical protein